MSSRHFARATGNRSAKRTLADVEEAQILDCIGSGSNATPSYQSQLNRPDIYTGLVPNMVNILGSYQHVGAHLKKQFQKQTSGGRVFLHRCERRVEKLTAEKSPKGVVLIRSLGAAFLQGHISSLLSKRHAMLLQASVSQHHAFEACQCNAFPCFDLIPTRL